MGVVGPMPVSLSTTEGAIGDFFGLFKEEVCLCTKDEMLDGVQLRTELGDFEGVHCESTSVCHSVIIWCE